MNHAFHVRTEHRSPFKLLPISPQRRPNLIGIVVWFGREESCTFACALWLHEALKEVLRL